MPLAHRAGLSRHLCVQREGTGYLIEKIAANFLG
jgi:hypothetical protein